MPAHNEWDVSYATIKFVERALATHSAVQSFSRERDILFRIDRTGGRTPVVAVLIGRYVIGQADVMKVMADYPDVDIIFANGNWCGYTEEAKELGLSNGVGVFHMGEFFGALHHSEFVQYTLKNHKGEPTYSYKSAS